MKFRFKAFQHRQKCFWATKKLHYTKNEIVSQYTTAFEEIGKNHAKTQDFETISYKSSINEWMLISRYVDVTTLYKTFLTRISWSRKNLGIF